MADSPARRGLHILRSAPLLPLLGVNAGAGLLLLTAVLARNSAVGWLTAMLGLSVCGAAAAYVLDEEAAAVADATPTSRLRRLRWRLSLVVLPAAVALSALLTLDRLDATNHWLRLAPLAAGSLAIGVALAAALRRGGAAAPGDLAGVLVVAGVLLFVAVDPFRHWVTAVPLGETPHSGRSAVLWTVVVLACGTITLVSSQDPARSGPRRRARR